jgi:AcrR family transcriptional regulator
MTKPVKKRAYSSPARTEQAAQTRARIVDAAGACFTSAGYARTTIRQIADAAGVAVDTVYATFGSKAQVLTALIDARLAPTGQRNVMDRPEAQAIRDADDQRTQLHLFAQDMAGVITRVRPVYEILRTASAVEPEMSETLTMMDGHRLDNMRRVAGWLALTGPLRVGVEQAAQTMWATVNPDVGRLLCGTLGYSEAEFAAWVEDTLVRALLP